MTLTHPTKGLGNPGRVSRALRLDFGPIYRRAKHLAQMELDGAYLMDDRPRARPQEAGDLAVSRVLAVAARQVKRWRDYGVTMAQAEELCDRLRVHPTECYESWYELLEEHGL